MPSDIPWGPAHHADQGSWLAIFRSLSSLLLSPPPSLIPSSVADYLLWPLLTLYYQSQGNKHILVEQPALLSAWIPSTLLPTQVHAWASAPNTKITFYVEHPAVTPGRFSASPTTCKYQAGQQKPMNRTSTQQRPNIRTQMPRYRHKKSSTTKTKVTIKAQQLYHSRP